MIQAEQNCTKSNADLGLKNSPVAVKLDFDTNSDVPSKNKLLMSKLFLRKDKKFQSDSYIDMPLYRKSNVAKLQQNNSLFDFSREETIQKVKSSLFSATQATQAGGRNLSTQEMIYNLTNTSPEHDSESSNETRTGYSCEIKNEDLDKVKDLENNESNPTSRKASSEFFEACPLLLPTSPNSKNPDLNTISSRTVADLITNKNQTYLIVDCRYEYEYKGGHIKGAINITSPEMLERVFLEHRNLIYNPSVLKNVKDNVQDVISNPRSYTAFGEASVCTPPIIIFHCEFSQKRGPRAFRALRNLDRQANAASWPSLFYPQIYVLEGGYRQFQADFPVLCTPENGYVEMLAFEYKEDYKIAREKEIKSWKKKSSVEINSPVYQNLKNKN